MIIIDENKLRQGTLRMIGEDYGVSEIKYNMLSDEGREAYFEEVIKVIDNESEEEWQYLIDCFKEEQLREQGKCSEVI